eukprot:8312494-Lingulodinium_polyedra.AAC.1
MCNVPRRGASPTARRVVHLGDVTTGIGPQRDGQTNRVQDSPGSRQNVPVRLLNHGVGLASAWLPML